MSNALSRVRFAFRAFGFIIGIVSTAHFAFVFWLLMHETTVNLIEPNPLVVEVELSMAVSGLMILTVILLTEICRWR